jgi:hypothetical protein
MHEREVRELIEEFKVLVFFGIFTTITFFLGVLWGYSVFATKGCL